MNRLGMIRGLGVLETAKRLGFIIPDHRHFGPCPACGAQKRARHDQREGPCYIVGSAGWKCNQCAMSGDAVRLAMWKFYGENLGPGDSRWRDFYQQCEQAGVLPGIGGVIEWTARRPEPVLHRINREELEWFWSECTPLQHRSTSWNWCLRRGFTPGIVRDLDLAREIPEHITADISWARANRMSWLQGWHMIIPAQDENGSIVTLRARWVLEEPPPAGLKSVPAAGGHGSASQAVMANDLGQMMLRGAAAPGHICIVEGEPDFLTRASTCSTGTAVLGIWNGAWSQAIADRIPRGSNVYIRCHEDDAGFRYQETIRQSLLGRVKLFGRKR